ncbi:hypothetical protein [Shumkonia mesophila]|uniref:hypothetical protein n=1 Tax=Shumkonia mesophila TaxID=2838854 RepID=UPI0029347A90|nr:hypothetical protein [Shumkonia mesophila]
MTRTIVMVALAGLLCACAAPAPTWEKPGTGAAEAKRFTQNCQAFAAVEADRRYRYDYPRETGGPMGPGDRFQATMADNEASLFKNRVFNECMQSHGYRKAGAAAKP